MHIPIINLRDIFLPSSSFLPPSLLRMTKKKHNCTHGFLDPEIESFYNYLPQIKNVNFSSHGVREKWLESIAISQSVEKVEESLTEDFLSS